MKNFEKQLKKISQNIRLTVAEKQDMRDSLSKYMAYKPLRHLRIPQVKKAQGKPSQVSWTNLIFGHRALAGALVLALVLTSSVGVAAASADALPGERLYRVKEIVESAQGALIIDDTKKAQWAIEQTHRRLEEAEKLAALGKLDEETERIITSRFETQSKEALQAMDTVRNESPDVADALGTTFDIGIEEHATALEEQNGHRRRIAHFARAKIISTKKEEAAAVAASPAPSPAGAKEIGTALNKKREKLEKQIVNLPEEEKAGVSAVLKDIEIDKKRATEDIEKGDTQAASKNLEDALRKAHKTEAKLLLKQIIRKKSATGTTEPVLNTQVKPQVRQTPTPLLRQGSEGQATPAPAPAPTPTKERAPTLNKTIQKAPAQQLQR